MDDLTGRVVKDMTNNERSDQFEVVEFPAILEVEDDTGEIIEKPLWPEFFDLDGTRTYQSVDAGTFQWNAQYQQQPTAEEAAIVKREWWNIWDSDSAPMPVNTL